MEDNKLVNYSISDEYEALVSECQAIITEGVFNERLERILTFGRLGERISQDPLFEKYGKGNLGFLKKISSDIGFSYSDICRAIQFYEKFKIVSPDSEGFSKFREGKNISWNKIKTFYLPEEGKKECEHDFEPLQVWRCKMCKRISAVNPNEK